MTPGEWIEWPGGECPLPPNTPVDVQFRCGETTESDAVEASEWDWTHGTGRNGEYDIIAYRIREAQQ